MSHTIHSKPLLRTSVLIPVLLLLTSATSSALAQDKKVKNPLLRDRINSGNTVTEFLKPIQNVQVTPLAAGAIISFDTREGANPTVRIGKTAPTQEPRGRDGKLQWVFKAEDEVPAYIPPRSRAAVGPTTHRLRLQPVLAPNTTYFYIIEILNGGQLVQETGSFSTISRRVKVVFQKINVLRGGDDTGTGDLMFQFFTNYDQTTNRKFDWLGGRSNPLKIADGGSTNVGKEYSLSNIDDLHLAVNGYDEDFLTVGAPAAGGPNSVQVAYPLDGAGHNRAGAWNVAKADFDLSSAVPSDKPTNVPFMLYSLPIPNNTGQDVAFAVSGYYTILPSLIRLRNSIYETIKVPNKVQQAPAIGRRFKINP
ncbi:hypothetical protein EON83_19265 [bacterium]|nr:MAG: hypothetical protein EON83_19265 [bacterium]